MNWQHRTWRREKVFEETASIEVARGLYSEKRQLFGLWDEFHHAGNKTSRALQRIMHSAYKFKVKTLLSGSTVNNCSSKYDQLRKEGDAYAAIRKKITFLELEDNANWEGGIQQFLDKVFLLEKAQKEFQAELKRQMREESSVRMNWTESRAKRKRRSNALLSSSVYWRRPCSPLKVFTGKNWKDSD